MNLLRHLLIAVLLLPLYSVAQKTYTIRGEVIDSVSKQGLGFVTVVCNPPSSLGTTTNAFGIFEFKSTVPVTKIAFTFIGYNPRIIIIESQGDNTHMRVGMVQSQYSLHKVTISAGENPANRIVRAVIAHRDENDPDRVETYKYTAYNKFIYSGIPPIKANASDSAKAALYKFLDEHYFFIMENVTETEFKKPDVKKEKIIGNKMSGVQDPSFTLISTQIQPFGFYRNFIYLVDYEYVNPFTKGSTERYFFNIEDTLYSGKDTIYRLSFRPWKGRKFDGLRGIAEISSDGYAIQHITAEPSDTVLSIMKIRVEQFSERVDGGRWFPVKFVTDIHYNNMFNNGMEVMMHGVTTLTKRELEPVTKRSDFDGVQVEMAPDASYQKSDFWNKYRTDSLTEREKETYHFIDSIGKSKRLDAKLRFIEGVIDGELRYRYVNFDVARFLWLNSIENERLGVGLRTNESVFKRVSFGGFVGYGLGDQRWKYGGEVRWKIYPRNDMYLKFNYWNDFEESGAIRFYKELDEFTTDFLRSFIVNSFDLVKRYQVDFTGRTLHYMHFDISAFSAQKSSITDYRFIRTINGERDTVSQFPYAGFKVAVRYGFKEKTIQAFHNTFFLTTYYPVFYAQITQGVNGLLGGEYQFTKLEAKVTYDVSTKALGDLYFQLAGGYVIGQLPLGDLFAGRGSYEAIGFYSDNTFQTMRLNEFYADKYVAFYYEEDLKTLLFRARKFQPKPLFVFNATVGTLSDPADHINYAFKTLDKGYYEAGLLINDIVSKEYLGVVRIGLGLGGFYRLGYYAFPNPWENFSLKGQISFHY